MQSIAYAITTEKWITLRIITPKKWTYVDMRKMSELNYLTFEILQIIAANINL
jgi:hypothetical protein